MQGGDRDRYNPTPNHRMAAALKSNHYAYQYTFALDAGRCDRKIREQTLPEALEWDWRDYCPKPL